MTAKAFNTSYDDMIGRTVLGRYQIVRRLATGGMGIVYLARAVGAAGFAKPVVIKRILPGLANNQEFAGMFIREAQILSHLQHPGIVNVIDFSEEDGAYLMVLEYVHGFQLGQWNRYLRSKEMQIPTDIILMIIINTLDSLHYAHTIKRPSGDLMQIIHRDISPSNILIDVEGHSKLVDFGIARMTGEEQGYQTQSRSFKGKLSYTAPEIFQGSHASVKSDVYSCGVVLHEILIGSNDFRGVDYPETFGKILNHTARSVHGFRDDAPDDIDLVIGKALAKNKEERYGSAKEFSKALRNIFTVSESETHELLASLIKRDFTDDMARYLSVETLQDLDTAWRTPSNASQMLLGDGRKSLPIERNLDTKLEVRHIEQFEDSDTKDENITSIPIILEDSPVISTSYKKSFYWIIWAVMGVLIVTTSLIVVVINLRDDKKEERTFLLVQTPIDTESSKTSNHPPSPPSATKPKESQEKEPEKESSRIQVKKPPRATKSVRNKIHSTNSKPTTKDPQQPDVHALTRAFRQRQSHIQSCFQSHAVELQGRPKISILFQVAPTGEVSKSQLFPTALANTELGKCLLNIANKTRFPLQKEQISFRIPVTAWRAKTN